MAEIRQVTLTVPGGAAVSDAFYASTSQPLWNDAADSDGTVHLWPFMVCRLQDRFEAIVVLSQLCGKHIDSDGHEAGDLLNSREFGGLVRAINLLAADGVSEMGDKVEALLQPPTSEVQP